MDSWTLRRTGWAIGRRDRTGWPIGRRDHERGMSGTEIARGRLLGLGHGDWAHRGWDSAALFELSIQAKRGAARERTRARKATLPTPGNGRLFDSARHDQVPLLASLLRATTTLPPAPDSTLLHSRMPTGVALASARAPSRPRNGRLRARSPAHLLSRRRRQRPRLAAADTPSEHSPHTEPAAHAWEHLTVSIAHDRSVPRAMGAVRETLCGDGQRAPILPLRDFFPWASSHSARRPAPRVLLVLRLAPWLLPQVRSQCKCRM